MNRPFKKTLLLLLFIGLYYLPLPGQATKAHIDSLHATVLAHPNDSFGVKALMGLTEEAYSDNPLLAESYCQKARVQAERIHFADGEMGACGWLAFLLEQRGSIDSALLYNERSLKIARKEGFKKAEGSILNNIAAIYKDQGKLKEAIQYYEQSIALNKSVNNAAGIATNYNNIGLIYYGQGQIPLALDYYNKSLHIEDSLGRKSGIATSLHNIAVVYKEQGQFEDAIDYGLRSLKLNEEEKDKYNMAYTVAFMGSIYELQGKLDKAIAQYKYSLDIKKSIDDKHGMAYSYLSLGGVYEKMDSVSKALENYSKSLLLFEELEDKSGMANALSGLGNVYFIAGNYENALSSGERSLALAKELGYPKVIRDAATLLDKVYRRSGRFEEALAMSDLYILMRDSVLNEETRKSAIRDKFKYEYETKESVLKAQQAEEVKQERLRRNASIAGFILVLLLAGVLFNRYKLKLRANKELEKKNGIISHEKDRAEKLLLNILPMAVANELKEKGSSAAKNYESVTVMFTDFQDFTLIGAKMSPQELVSEIDFYFKAFDEIIGKYRVEKIKTIGDAYMCASGIPGTFPEHAVEMVQAAIAIRDFIDKTKQERIKKGQPFFEIRIGINTGPLVAGVVGSTKFSYDIWGDSVNLASRMESNSKTGKINISSSTYELVKNRFACSYRGKIEAKNKGQVDMYFVDPQLN
jgi:class 3 adenylate cyclase